MSDYFEKIKNVDERQKNIVNGYIREYQSLLQTDNNLYNNIPQLIWVICLSYYALNKQILILEDVELKNKSIELVTGNDNDFIKFLIKILRSKLKDRIWGKCDPNKNNEISTEKFVYFWLLPVTLFKVAVHQRETKDNTKPKLDQKQFKKEYIHFATWIIRTKGEIQNDGAAKFVLKKENYNEKLIDYAKQYAHAKGEIVENH